MPKNNQEAVTLGLSISGHFCDLPLVLSIKTGKLVRPELQVSYKENSQQEKVFSRDLQKVTELFWTSVVSATKWKATDILPGHILLVPSYYATDPPEFIL